jgi:hypothetical protein
VTASTLPKIVTCSWQAYRREFGTAVRTSLGVPQWVWLPDPAWSDYAHWPYVAELAPRRAYWNAPDFDARYLAQVARFAGDLDAKLAAIPAENGALVLLCWERQITGPDQCPSAARGGLRARPPRHPDRGDGPGALRLPVTRQ